MRNYVIGIKIVQLLVSGLDMLGAVGFPAEGLATSRTHEPLLGLCDVNVLDVLLEVGFPAKGFAARRTNEWSFAFVNYRDVSVLAILSREFLAADLAGDDF
jgi:hypothetical protein